MTNIAMKAPDALREFRRESQALSKVPGNRKGTLPESRRHELSTIVSQALATPVPLDSIDGDLAAFPPQVVGRAVASVWTELEPSRREAVLARLRTLDSERLLGEVLPMSLNLLRSSATALVGSEVLGLLPPNEKATQRVSTEVFGTDGIAIAALRVPSDEDRAAAMFRVLLRAAVHEKAQPYRRLQLLRLMLPWLAHDARHRRPALSEILGQVRGLSKKLDGSVGVEFAELLTKEASWSSVLRPEAAQEPPVVPPMAPKAASALVEKAPSDVSSPEVAPVNPNQATAPQPAPQLSIEEARSAVQSLRDRSMREARALDRVLGALKAAEALRGQTQSEVDRAREVERRLSAQVVEQRTQIENLQAQVARSIAQTSAVETEVAAKSSECDRLTADLVASRTREEVLLAEQKSQAATWSQQKQQLELQVVQNAEARVSELRQRLAGRIDKTLADIPARAANVTGGDVAAVLHTRIHEVLDLLRKEGIPIKG
jgi:hypothetical protein